MPKYSYGPAPKGRVLRFVDALLQYANGELGDYELKDLSCTWQDGDTSEPRLVVRTKLRALAHLTSHVHGEAGLSEKQIREVLRHYLPELDILQDHRDKPQGSDSWHFSLTLQSKNAADSQEEIKQCWDSTWGKKGKPSQPESSISELIGVPRSFNRGAPFQAPPLPDHFVERPEQQKIVKEQLLNEGTKVGTLVVSAIYGLGGIGKSVLASKLAYDKEVQTRFADGVLWATLGQNPDILPLLSGWIQALGDYSYKPTAIESASNQLRTLLYDKRALLVVDDIWNPAHLEPFRVGGENCCVLVTTREARIPEAHRYDLDVMTADQALELMTRKLSGKLTETNREQALAFAERVGYLPLALELAASQIEEGVTWTELLEDFRDEVIRLETLDLYEQDEIPDHTKRRRYSLLACFNLSLKLLSSKQLQQFAWLGVLPEDVSLTGKMAETLWKVTSRKAKKILRIFRAKALVLQGAKQTDGELTYRMHDLMHDLAKRLLMSPQYPEDKRELSGLGLTRAEAHSELLEYYRAKTENGQWHTLVDDGYIYAHITWHMEQAEQIEEIHRLLWVSNDDGRNGWYESCDAIGKSAVFVSDVGRAWQLTVKYCEQERSKAISLLFRYALIRSSLKSLASNLPAGLVGELVNKGVWKIGQGLAYIKHIQEEKQRVDCIAAIISGVSKALLPETLITIDEISSSTYRFYLLCKLGDRFPSIWPNLLNIIPQLRNRERDYYQEFSEEFSYKVLALNQLVTKLPLIYIPDVIKITHQIDDLSDQVLILIGLAKRQTKLWPKALDITRKIKDENKRSCALIDIAKHLPELWSEALENTRKIKSKHKQSLALIRIAQHRPELWPEALSVTRQIRSADKYLLDALTEISKDLPKELWPEVLDLTRQIRDEYTQACALIEISKNLPKELWLDALNITRQIQHYNAPRAWALHAMAQNLPELWTETLDVSRRIYSETDRAWMLALIAQHLPELWPEVLENTRQIPVNYSRLRFLSGISEQLPTELLPDFLAVVRQISDSDAWLCVLGIMAQHSPELWQEALLAIEQMEHAYVRANALREIAKNLPQELWSRALEIVHQIKNDNPAQVIALSAMAQHLSKLWPEVLEKTLQIEDEIIRSGVLSEMSEYLPAELWSQVMEMIRHFKSRRRAQYLLLKMAQNLPAKLWPEGLELIRQKGTEHYLIAILRQAGRNIPAELWPKLLEGIRHFKSQENRTLALIAIAQHLPKIWPEAIESTYQIKDISKQVNALREIAKFLPEFWPEALGLSCQAKIEKNLPELWSQTLTLISQIKDEFDRSRALCEIVQG